MARSTWWAERYVRFTRTGRIGIPIRALSRALGRPYSPSRERMCLEIRQSDRYLFLRPLPGFHYRKHWSGPRAVYKLWWSHHSKNAVYCYGKKVFEALHLGPGMVACYRCRVGRGYIRLRLSERWGMG